MRTTIWVATILFALVGVFVGYSNADIGGSLVWAVLWGLGGLLIGRAIVSTAKLASRFWQVALAVVLFLVAVVVTWRVRF